MTTNVLVIVKYPDTGVRCYQFEADEAVLEDIKHAHGRSVYLDDDEPFIEEFAELFEEYEVSEDAVDRVARQVFWFTVLGVHRVAEDTTIQ